MRGSGVDTRASLFIRAILFSDIFEDMIEGVQDFGTDRPDMASAALASIGMIKGIRDKILEVLGSINGKVCTSEDEFNFYQSMMGGQDDASEER